MNRLQALIGLVLASWILNQISPGSGQYLMLGAFALWFIVGDGMAQSKIAWKKFMQWLPT